MKPFENFQEFVYPGTGKQLAPDRTLAYAVGSPPEGV